MERNIVKLLVLCSLVVRFVNAFPESGDPITEEPPLYRPDTAANKVVIFENAACSSWDLVLQSQYVPPSPWKSWSKVILDFSVSLMLKYTPICSQLQPTRIIFTGKRKWDSV